MPRKAATTAEDKEAPKTVINPPVDEITGTPLVSQEEEFTVLVPWKDSGWKVGDTMRIPVDLSPAAAVYWVKQGVIEKKKEE